MVYESLALCPVPFEQPDVERPDWPMIGRLLEAGRFEQVAALLWEAEGAAGATGDDVLANLLATTRQICLACNEHGIEKESRRQAYEEAISRERQLQQRLQLTLNLLKKHRTAVTADGNWQSVNAALCKIDLSGSDVVGRHIPWQPLSGLLERENLGPVHLPLTAAATATSILPAEAKIKTPSVTFVKTEDVPSLTVYVLGAFRVYQNDHPVADWNGLKGQMVFKYLLANRGKSISRDILMDLFWPEVDPEAARRNLHQAIYSLRQTLKNGNAEFQHVLFENDRYLLNFEMDLWLDYDEFVRRVQAGRRLESVDRLLEAMGEYSIAEGLYQGDFLEEDPYEEWTIWPREQTRNMYLDITDRLGEHYARQGEYMAALTLSQKLLARDNYHEGAHRRLMRCYAAQNQRHLVVRQYQICREVLESELGLTPSAETVALYRQLTA